MEKLKITAVRKEKRMAGTDTQRAYCQNCCLTTRDKYFAIFAGWLALIKCWEAATSAICHHVSRHAGTVHGRVKKIILLHFEIIMEKIRKMKIKKIAIAFCFFLVISTRLLAQYFYIPDDNLRKELHKMEFTNNDSLLDASKIKGILQLDLRNKEIEKLDGLQHFEQVWELRLWNNKIKELKDLPPNLTYLSCSKNIIKELKDLPPKLTHLDCSENEIKELNDLPATLANLDCSNNRIEVIKNLPSNLSTLRCTNNVIKTITNLPDNLKSLDFSNNLVTKFPELPLNLESINYYNNKININTLPKLYKTAIPCDHPDQNCLPYELANWKLLNNNIKDTIFEILELKVTIHTSHDWGFGYEVRRLHFIKSNNRLICENENRCYKPGEADFSKEIINENIENTHTISIVELKEFLNNLYIRKMKLEFQIDDSAKTIDLSTKRNGTPPCSSSCIDCGWSTYKYEIFTTRDTIDLTYNTQTFYDAPICSMSWSQVPANINHPERIGAILNLLYIYKLEELVQKRKYKKYGELDSSILEWARNYK
jgi:hypothetical protein